jgi:hypothetical protein
MIGFTSSRARMRKTRKKARESLTLADEDASEGSRAVISSPLGDFPDPGSSLSCPHDETIRRLV